MWKEIIDLGLQPYIEHLDTNGYTVIPPEIANPNGLAERMLEACLDISERRNGERPDLMRGMRGKSRSADSPTGDAMKAILLEDPVFEEALMKPSTARGVDVPVWLRCDTVLAVFYDERAW